MEVGRGILAEDIASGKYYYDLEQGNVDKLVEYPGFAVLFQKWGIC